jgi:hypothetical protein
LKLQSIFEEVSKFGVEKNPIAQKTILHKNAGHGGVWAVVTGAQIFFSGIYRLEVAHNIQEYV